VNSVIRNAGLYNNGLFDDAVGDFGRDVAKIGLGVNLM
jgi:hypothetical protein